MSRLNKTLLFMLLLVFSLFAYFPQTTKADNELVIQATPCIFTLTPTPNQNMDKLTIKITSDNFSPDREFRAVFKWASGSTDSKYSSANLKFDSNNKIYLTYDKAPGGWQSGPYQISFIERPHTLEQADCVGSFTIETTPQQNCTVSIPTSPIDPKSTVKLHITGLPKNTTSWTDITGTGGYKILVNNNSNKVLSKETGADEDVDLEGKFDVGTYSVKIMNRCGWAGTGCKEPEREQCNCAGFKVNPFTKGGGGEISCSEVTQGIQCKKIDDPSRTDNDAICTTSQARAVGCSTNAISTAIGCVRTDPTGFAQDLLKFGVGIGGGLAFLMMLLGAFQMLTSAGNPETLNAGKERLTSAIIGLLIVIFAVLLLQIIGFDILQIPGFNR